MRARVWPLPSSIASCLDASAPVLTSLLGKRAGGPSDGGLSCHDGLHVAPSGTGPVRAASELAVGEEGVQRAGGENADVAARHGGEPAEVPGGKVLLEAGGDDDAQAGCVEAGAASQQRAALQERYAVNDVYVLLVIHNAL